MAVDIDIRPRTAWGARYADGAGNAPLPATAGLFLHHIGGGNPGNGPAPIRALEAVGQQRFGAGISYTWLVSPDGTIWQGHSVGRLGSHTKGYNTTGRGVCLVGTNTITAAQAESVARLAAHGVERRWWPTVILRGHRDVRATDCPGAVPYAAIPAIRTRAHALLNAAPTPPPTLPPPLRPQEHPLMSLTSDQQTKLADDATVAAVRATAIDEQLSRIATRLDRVADLLARDFGYDRAAAELGPTATFDQVKARASEIHRAEIARIKG